MGARLQGEREREARVTQLGLGPPLPGTPAAQSTVPEQLVAPAPDLVPQGGATAQDNGEQVSLTQQEDTGDGEEDAVPWHVATPGAPPPQDWGHPAEEELNEEPATSVEGCSPHFLTTKVGVPLGPP